MRSNPRCDSGASLVFTIGLAVLCLLGQLSKPVLASSAPSHRLLSLASMYSGTFSNEEQVREQEAKGQPKLDIVSPVIYPVHVPEFDPAVTFYFEQILNGEVKRVHIMVLEEDGVGLIDFKLYNLTRPLSEKPWTNDTDPLPLPPDDLDYLEGCDVTYYEMEDGIFFGEWPTCLTSPPKNDRTYAATVTCNMLGFLVPGGGNEPEASSHVPYQLRTITRFPLLPYTYAGVDNYQNPCL